MSHFTVSFIVRGKVTRQCPLSQFLKRKVNWSGESNLRPSAYQPSVLTPGQAGSHILFHALLCFYTVAAVWPSLTERLCTPRQDRYWWVCTSLDSGELEKLLTVSTRGRTHATCFQWISLSSTWPLGHDPCVPKIGIICKTLTVQ